MVKMNCSSSIYKVWHHQLTVGCVACPDSGALLTFVTLGEKLLQPSHRGILISMYCESSFPPLHFLTATNNSSKFENFTSHNPKSTQIMRKFAAARGRCQLNALLSPRGHVTGGSVRAPLKKFFSFIYIQV